MENRREEGKKEKGKEGWEERKGEAGRDEEWNVVISSI